MMNDTQETSVLLAHAGDLLARAEKGEITYSAFLTPREQRAITRAFPARNDMCFMGGYERAERCRLICLPPWLEGADKACVSEALADIHRDCLVALCVRGSGFRTLSHKDFLGATLHLGIERSRIGDVCVVDERTAILFCDRVLFAFLQENLTRVANDAVTVTEYTLPDTFDGGVRTTPITDTVASPRADSVVAALANVSRERACELLRAGLVEIDYESVSDKDAPVKEGVVVVIRGKGKFIIRSLSEQTRKGRYRLVADKYL